MLFVVIKNFILFDNFDYLVLNGFLFVIDFEGDIIKIVNCYEVFCFKEYLKIFYKFYEVGYILKDVVISDILFDF